MPALEVSDLKQKAVLWANNGLDDYGQPKVSAPVEINVRWVWSKELNETPTESGEVIVGEVAVDRVIEAESILWLGTLASLPATKTDLCKVVGYRETPDVKGRNPRRSVTIVKFNDTLPAIT